MGRLDEKNSVGRKKTTYVGPKLEVADAASDVLVVGVVQVSVHDLFGQRERSVEPESRRRRCDDEHDGGGQSWSERTNLLLTTERLSSIRW